MKKGSVTLVGISPLMMGAMSETQLLSLPGAPGGGKKVQQPKDASAEDIAGAKIYRDENGHMGIPAQNVFAMLKHAGRRVSYGTGRTKVSTAESTFLTEFFRLLPSSVDQGGDGFFPFEGLDDKGEKTFIVDKRRGVNKATDGAMCVVRPKFKEWAIKIEFEYDETVVNADTIESLFERAATGSGLCEFRPNKGGPFGCFEVTAKVGLEKTEGDKKPEVEAGEESEVPASIAGRNGHGAPVTGETSLTV